MSKQPASTSEVPSSLSTPCAESSLPTKPSSSQVSEPAKSRYGVPTDWIAIYQEGVHNEQLKDENEWDMCSEMESLGAKEQSKTWNQLNRERMIRMGEKRDALADEKSMVMIKKKEKETLARKEIAGEKSIKKGKEAEKQMNASVERERSMRRE